MLNWLPPVSFHVDTLTHRAITRLALKRFGFERYATLIVTNANLDEDRNQYDWRNHFDRVPGITNYYAIKKSHEHYKILHNHVIVKIRKRDHRLALLGVGTLFHALQDFCAHSNLVELSEKSRKLIEDSFFTSSLAFRELILTGYDPETQSELPPGDAYPHLLQSKDTRQSPWYAKARTAGLRLCTRELRVMRAETSYVDWALLKNYQEHGRGQCGKA